MKTSYKVIGKEYFKNVLPTSKRFKRVLEAYRNSKDMTLYDIYKDFSSAKYRAYIYWMNFYDGQLNGRRFRIVSHNSITFSIAFRLRDDILYITKSEAYRIIGGAKL